MCFGSAGGMDGTQRAAIVHKSIDSVSVIAAPPRKLRNFRAAHVAQQLVSNFSFTTNRKQCAFLPVRCLSSAATPHIVTPLRAISKTFQAAVDGRALFSAVCKQQPVADEPLCIKWTELFSFHFNFFLLSLLRRVCVCLCVRVAKST